MSPLDPVWLALLKDVTTTGPFPSLPGQGQDLWRVYVINHGDQFRWPCVSHPSC